MENLPLRGVVGESPAAGSDPSREGCVPLRSSDGSRCPHPTLTESIRPSVCLSCPVSCLPRVGQFEETAPLLEAFGPGMMSYMQRWREAPASWG